MFRFQLKITHHTKKQENIHLNENTVNKYQHQDDRIVRVI